MGKQIAPHRGTYKAQVLNKTRLLKNMRIHMSVSYAALNQFYQAGGGSDWSTSSAGF